MIEKESKCRNGLYKVQTFRTTHEFRTCEIFKYFNDVKMIHADEKY